MMDLWRYYYIHRYVCVCVCVHIYFMCILFWNPQARTWHVQFRRDMWRCAARQRVLIKCQQLTASGSGGRVIPEARQLPQSVIINLRWLWHGIRCSCKAVRYLVTLSLYIYPWIYKILIAICLLKSIALFLLFLRKGTEIKLKWLNVFFFFMVLIEWFRLTVFGDGKRKTENGVSKLSVTREGVFMKIFDRDRWLLVHSYPPRWNKMRITSRRTEKTEYKIPSVELYTENMRKKEKGNLKP